MTQETTPETTKVGKMETTRVTKTETTKVTTAEIAGNNGKTMEVQEEGSTLMKYAR